MPSSLQPNLAVPTLETERLRLRGHAMDDFIHCAALWADPNVTRHIGGKPCTEEESWARFLRYFGHWLLLGFGYWVAEDKATGNFVGEVGFADYKRSLQPSLKDVPEIGWALASHAHGKGFATEAVRAVVAWGDEHFVAPQTACIVAPENHASIRVAVKCGYRQSQLATYKGEPTKLLIRDRKPSPKIGHPLIKNQSPLGGP
jgi:RimJ/RimL family protein N-acetyltransferase